MGPFTTEEVDTAYHEAAHGVGHVVLGHDLYTVTRDPPAKGKLGGTHGRVLPSSIAGKPLLRHKFTAPEIEALKDDITILLLGDIAEKKLRGSGREFDANNPATADDTAIVGRMTAVWPIPEEADAEIKKLLADAETLVQDNWSYIERVAKQLLQDRTLTGDQVRAMRTV
jgi:hypothetical protein